MLTITHQVHSIDIVLCTIVLQIQLLILTVGAGQGMNLDHILHEVHPIILIEIFVSSMVHQHLIKSSFRFVTHIVNGLPCVTMVELAITQLWPPNN